MKPRVERVTSRFCWWCGAPALRRVNRIGACKQHLAEIEKLQKQQRVKGGAT